MILLSRCAKEVEQSYKLKGVYHVIDCRTCREADGYVSICRVEVSVVISHQMIKHGINIFGKAWELYTYELVSPR